MNAKLKSALSLGLKLAVMGGLFYWISRQIDFRDHLTLPASTPGGAATEIAGRLVDEGAREIVFETESGETVRVPAGVDGGPAVRPGFLRLLRGLDPGFAILAMLVYVAALSSGIVRWLFLLRAQGIEATYGRVFQLSFVGYFFNNIVPGLTGGDVVKAYYVARGEEKKAAAVLSVVVDRLVGLFVLTGIGAVAVLAGREPFRSLDPSKADAVALGTLGFFALEIAGGLVFFSRRLRRLLQVERILGWFHAGGIVRKADAALFAYRFRKETILLSLALSIVAHSILIVVHWLLARALGITASLASFFITVPIMQTISALPVAPAGWGLGEATYIQVLRIVGVGATQAVALSIVFRLVNILWSLPGGLLLASLKKESKA